MPLEYIGKSQGRRVSGCLILRNREFDADIPDHPDGLAHHLECLEYYKIIEKCQLSPLDI